MAAVVKQTLESAPKGATYGSTRSLAEHLGLRQSTVSRIWRAFGLCLQRAESVQRSADLQLVDKVRDIVGLYLAPPDYALSGIGKWGADRWASHSFDWAASGQDWAGSENGWIAAGQPRGKIGQLLGSLGTFRPRRLLFAN